MEREGAKPLKGRVAQLILLVVVSVWELSFLVLGPIGPKSVCGQ